MGEKEARETCAEIETTCRRAVAVKADVSLAANIARLVMTVEAELGPVAIVVNNAGIAQPQPFAEIAEKDWDDIIAINLKSVFLCRRWPPGEAGLSTFPRLWATWSDRTAPPPRQASSA